MNKLNKFIVVLIIVLAGFFLWQIYFPVNFGQNEIFFKIDKGEGSKQISADLQKQGVVVWAPIFRLYVLLTNSADKLQAGTYSFSGELNIPKIVKKFTLGKTAKENAIIIEGWNLRNIGYYFQNKGMFQAEDFWKVAGLPATDYSVSQDSALPVDFSKNYSFLESKPKNIGLEGFLFPDTYELAKDTAPKDVIKKMLDNFDLKLTTDLRTEIERQNKTIFQIITMASILEKEVKTKEDKKMVSGILWKRIKLGMPLQVDATIAYIKGIDQWRYSFKDTRIESPFNAYLNYGLPVGPISNPGIDSIVAAIYPTSSEYLYYLSTMEGETIFSKTLEEHNINKVKYLDNENIH